MQKIVLLALIIFLTGKTIYGQSVYDRLNISGKKVKKDAPQKNDDGERGEYVPPASNPEDGQRVQRNRNIPIEIVQDDNVNELGLSSKASRRRDGAVEEEKEFSEPLDYEKLYQKDVVFRARVWRDIDALNPKNRSYFFRNDYFDESGNDRLVGVMINALKGDSLIKPIEAFSSEDDRFTTPISFQEALSGFGGGKDTAEAYDADGNISSYKIMNRPVNFDSITKFRIKEEWIFNKKTGRMYIRILGIAPLKNYTSSDGYTYENSLSPVFWIYYPDIRKKLVNVKVNDPMHLGNTINWEEVFENRLFASKIIKSSLDPELGITKYPMSEDQSQAIENLLIEYKKKLYNSY